MELTSYQQQHRKRLPLFFHWSLPLSPAVQTQVQTLALLRDIWGQL